MTLPLVLSFDHRECDAGVDLHLPLRDGTSLEMLRQRHQPSCPICGQPMQYVGFRFSRSNVSPSKSLDDQGGES